MRKPGRKSGTRNRSNKTVKALDGHPPTSGEREKLLAGHLVIGVDRMPGDDRVPERLGPIGPVPFLLAGGDPRKRSRVESFEPPLEPLSPEEEEHINRLIAGEPIAPSPGS